MRAISATVSPANPTALVRLDNFATAVLGGQIVCSGGGQFTLAHSCDDPCDLVNPVPVGSMFWDNSLLPLAAQSGGANTSFRIMACPLWFRLSLQAAAGAPTAWNPADKSASVTLSGGNLIATWNGSGGGVRSITSQTSGKVYFEAQFTTINASTWVGLANATSLLTIANTANVVLSQLDASAVQGNGTTLGPNGGFLNAGQWGSFAIDLTSALFWYRPNNGLWNNNASANPATGVGGYSISYLTGPFFAYCGAQAGGAGNAVTANFGGSAFVGAVPSGFTAGFLSGGSGYVGAVRATFLQVGEHSHSNITQGPFAPPHLADLSGGEGSNFSAMAK